MINSGSAEIAVNLSEIMVDSGISLVPKNMSLISELTKSLNSGMCPVGMPSGKDFIAMDIVMASTGTNNGNPTDGRKLYIQSSHDTYMDAYREDLTKLCIGYIGFARSVVNARVNAFNEDLVNRLSNYKYRDPEDFFEVSYFKPDPVFYSSTIHDEVATYRNTAQKKDEPELLDLRSLRDESFEIDKYVLTGFTEDDLVIQSWISSIGKETAVQYITDIVREYAMDIKSRMDYALINYLFYRNLAVRQDINVAATLVDLRIKTAVNRDYFASKLCAIIESYEKELRTGSLFTTATELSFSFHNDRKNNITIYEESFKKFTEKGGNIDAIFGYLSKAPNISITADALAEKKDAMIAQWQTVRSLYLITLANKRLDTFKQLLRMVVSDHLAMAPDGGETDYLKEHPGFLDKTKQLINEYIDNIQISEMEDIDTICLNIIAKIRFRFSNAYFILKSMKEYLALNDKMKPQDAALLSVVKYLTTFLLECVDVVRV